MIRKPKKWKLYRFLVVLALCYPVLLSHAQENSFALIEVPFTQRHTSQQSLQEVLSRLQEHYGISFIYESEVVSSVIVTRSVKFNASVESTLTDVLRGLNLKFKKINDQTYVIAPLKENEKDASPSKESPKLKKQSKSNREGEGTLIEVSGAVNDENDQPLPGVNVLEKGTTNGTTTDANGQFALQVNDENSVLTFSFIGYEIQEVPVRNQTQFSIKLAPSVEALQEVVVVGYGTQKKVNLTGAVSTVNAEEIQKLNVNQTSQLLTGQVAGLTVVQGSGQPGKEALQIRVRGIGTFSDAGNSPLVLVDGLASSLDNVDFNDIESISVLKDAASASIYGTRAANGVILIETKKGKQGKVKINYHGFVGIQRPTEIPKIVDSWVYAQMINEALTNDGNSPEYSAEDIENFKAGSDPDLYPNKRHYDDLISSGSGIQTSHHLNVMGGNEKSSYMVSFGYMNQEGLVAETFFKRYNVRANFDNKISEKLKMSLILSGRSSQDGEPTAVDKNPGPGVEGLLNYAIKIPNTIPGRMSTGYYGNQTGFTVEGWMDSESYIKNDNLDLYSNVSLDWDIAKGLKLTGRGGYEFGLTQYEMFRPVFVVDQFITQAPSELRARSTTNSLTTLQAFVNYDLPLGKHNIHLLGGYSQEANRNDFLEGFRDRFPNNELYELSAGSASNQQAAGSGYEWALRSFFGRVTYNYDEKYLFEANARYDGSSRFPEDNRYGLFPSLSGGWRISEEEFFDVSWISELKLRGSWGKLGNQNIGNYPYQQVLFLGLNTPFGKTEVLSPGAGATVVPNRDISWESTRVVDFGLDLELFRGKLNITGDYYDKITSGILYNITSSTVLGMKPSVQNAGVVSNKGFDVSVQHRNSVGKFTYSIGANFSSVRNEVVDLANIEKDIANGYFVGYPLNSIYGYEAIGLFVDQADIDAHAKQPRTPKPGTIKFRDISGPEGVPDGIVDADHDRRIIGNEFPKYNYGVNLGAQYKGFDLSVLLQGVAGVDKIIDGYQGNAFIQGSNPQQWMYNERWTAENPNPNASYPRLSILGGQEEQFYESTFTMQNAAYLRVNNLQLGYAFPSALVNKLRMTNIRLYASVRNLITFDHFRKGWDPEMGIGYPPVRVFNFGVNLNF